ncbi:hypothetical protein Vadar_006955 [Vaccinium darrowii]|uniref:Uncharacterized protein n=1 Tax=Vaccinium darrowii TaxID=229202 RepID=A0ACB7Z2W9_9ERIC|nr:hypothetical protein Vadar_006955 [Vaccinium darrowii]
MAQVSNVHVVNDDGGKKGKGKRKGNFQSNKDSNKKPKGSCWHCGKPRHYKKDCRSLNKKKKPEKAKAQNNFAAVIFEINMLEDAKDWWIDSRATRHVCNDRTLFSTYEPVSDGEVLYMGNYSTTAVKGKRKVDLKFTSGQVVCLFFGTRESIKQNKQETKISHTPPPSYLLRGGE